MTTCFRRECMTRGVTPRRPTKTGRHESVKAKITRPALAKTTSARAIQPRSTGLVRPKDPVLSKKRKSGNAYNPLAPERISEILKRLDQLYPDVTCDLTHKDP